MAKKRILSGMRPSGKLHLGNYLGALTNWVRLQDEYECFFMIADWHALTDRTDTTQIKKDVEDVLIDWLAAGLDPEKSVLFLQSHIKEHAELHLILSMITPLSWLERCPTYKEKIEAGAATNYGLLGYPVLQAADILVYQAERVPVGEDQLPHLELTREIARRFNSLYGRVFPEPEPILSHSPRIMGIDGKKKMGKSYNNYIALSDTPEVIKKKVMTMFTDPAKIYMGDPGHPDECNVYAYHKVFGSNLGEDLEKIASDCKKGKLGCTSCKAKLTEVLVEYLAPFREKRRQIEEDKTSIQRILTAGREKASHAASFTLKQVREAMQMGY
ncbi:tryptophan--tRNA ligase [Candidatus Aerophobetes bacterium]|uniref:Tryptophan--tRNA ligase n=1 Tax=Aerophobetes bacterium TaxID=2030807 RepID=A0A662DF35_UNCAE|nr:MAG: tryptophan--tRNA ligase [Candidatus Aerophobetes bacterium]